MKDSRNRAAASVTKEGSFMVTGGLDDRGVAISSTEIMKNENWQQGPALPLRMSDHCQVTSKSGVVVAGEEV